MTMPCNSLYEKIINVAQSHLHLEVHFWLLLCIFNRELLFRDIYYKFCEHPVGKVMFLESLEPYIMNDK